MSQSKEQRIKKLKKGHVWPSVLVFIIALTVTAVVAVLMMSTILAYFASDRVITLLDDAKNVGQMLAGGLQGENERDVLDYLENSSSLADAVYLLDENREPVAGFGGATYDPAEREMEDTMGFVSVSVGKDILDPGVSVYRDLETAGGEDVNERNALIAAVVKSYFEGDTSLSADGTGAGGSLSGSKEVLYAYPFWVGAPLQSGQTAMVKCNLNFYASDIDLAVLVAICITVVAAIPLLYLFFSLVKNAVIQSRMTRLLYTDMVTNGKSWLWFMGNVDKVLRAWRNANMTFAIVDFTLMKYGNYCTCHGVQAGEKLLENINRRLDLHLRKPECCAHNGKSSYGLLLRCADKESCVKRVEEIQNEIVQALGHGGIVFHSGVCFVEPFVKDGRKRASRRTHIDIDEYFNSASAARASLADEDQTGVAVFDEKLLEERLWAHKVEERMQSALENEEFKVYLQPKYNPVTEKLTGAEALVRWINDEDGFISPGRFIPIFEKNGFITKLDDYMISHVAKLQADWLKAGKEVVPVSVNVSRAHFADPGLAEHICALVDEYQLPHHLLEIELTESAFFDDKAALLETVRRLKEMGFDISMDDFGAGYSSLNSLKDLPLDVLKLDAEFFRGEDDEERGEIVISQAIDLAKKLNMRIVAEGIEKKNQVDFLAAHDCDMIQGFYFAKPMPANEYEEKLG